MRAAQKLADSGAEALITCRCGEGVAKLMKDAGIRIYKAEEGTAEENIAMLSQGKLSAFAFVQPGVLLRGNARA